LSALAPRSLSLFLPHWGRWLRALARRRRGLKPDAAGAAGPSTPSGSPSIARLSELVEAMRLMMGGLERDLVAGNVLIEDVPERLLSTVDRSLLISMNFELSHHWTFCVYQARKDPVTGLVRLHLVSHRRSVSCPLKDARIWEVGQGAVGMAYQRKRFDVVVPDAHDPKLGSLYDLQAAKIEDRARYRSIIATPISVGPANDVWGVVVATCDLPNHFGHRTDAVPTPPAYAVKMVATMIALAVAAIPGAIAAIPPHPSTGQPSGAGGATAQNSPSSTNTGRGRRGAKKAAGAAAPRSP
jgi:hypothetical protein